MIQRNISFRVATALLGIGVVVLASSASTVGALEGTTEPQESTTNTTTEVKPTDSASLTEKRAAELQRRQAALEKQKQAKQEKEQELKEKRLKQCQAKADGVNTALSKITENRRRIFNRLTEISDKVQSFVTNKQLTVENYDQLVATLNARKGEAEASINQVNSANNLDCSDTQSPKDQLHAFREKRQGSVDALKEYRGAIKKLILAVKVSIASHKGLEGRSTTTGDTQ